MVLRSWVDCFFFWVVCHWWIWVVCCSVGFECETQEEREGREASEVGV